MMRRRFVGAVGAFFLLFATVSATADAQGLLGLFGCGGSTECIRSAGKTVTVERFDPVLPGRYPAIILLHGSDGMEVHQREYEGVAQRLAGSGYVAILLHYYDATGTPEQPVSWDILESSRYRVWKRVVKDAISYASCLENVDSDRIGLVGFSLGAVPVPLSVSRTAG
jgi:dienelactone hydrolase